MLPSEVSNEYQAIFTSRNPDGIINGYFLELKQSENGSGSSIRNSIREAKNQKAEIVYLNIENINDPKSYEFNVFRNLKGQIEQSEQKDSYDGISVFVSFEGKDFIAYEVDTKNKDILIRMDARGKSEAIRHRSNNNLTKENFNVNIDAQLESETNDELYYKTDIP